MSLPTWIPLAQADQEGIGNKARQLARLLKHKPKLFSIPEGVLLLPTFNVEHDMKVLIKTLLKMKYDAFAVRSCGLNEDGAHESMAGKFHTELNVCLHDLDAAIVDVQSSFGEDLSNSSVLIQGMLSPDFAGVLFTRSPDNYGLASCEYTEGLADAVVSGKVEPKAVQYGRWTGALYPAQPQHNDMLCQLFLSGLVIEDSMGEPQDIEWAYDKKLKRLFILQSRNITAQLYDKYVAEEQERLADIALAGKRASKGLSVFTQSSVQEVVHQPTLLTQDMMQHLYAPSGALGKALDELGLPCPEINQAYVLPVFGKLYANIEVERRLFGLNPRRLWAHYKLKRKLLREPKKMLAWLDAQLQDLPTYPIQSVSTNLNANFHAKALLEGMSLFVHQVYPVAYAATILAQISEKAGIEKTKQGSLTSHLLRDLSRLHHSKDMNAFLERWGLRSANDYELSEPRFCESEEMTLAYAAQYAHIPLDDIPLGKGFLHRKELAKHLSICWIYPLRQEIRQLALALEVDVRDVCGLAKKDLEAFVQGEYSNQGIRQLCLQKKSLVTALNSIVLPDDISLAAIECLEAPLSEGNALRGKMVSTRKTFSGFIRIWNGEGVLSMEADEVLLASCLQPELVGSFAGSAGCIANMGGSLSHAAIVAREMDYPIVVLAGATKVLKEGDYIEVTFDGSITISSKKRNCELTPSQADD